MKLKVEWMCYVIYIELCISILCVAEKKMELSLTSIIGCCLGIMLLYLLIWNVILGLGHIAASMYYYSKGFGCSPVLLYPFIFYTDKETPIQLFWNFFNMCEYSYPSRLFFDVKNNYNKNKVSELCQNAQLISLIAEICLCLLCGGILFCKGSVGMAFACVLFIITLILIANMKTDTYHGCFVRMRYIKQGYIEMYLARYVILYSNENHIFYDGFEKIVLEDLPEDFEYMCLETIKHMYMIKCVNDRFNYPDKIRHMIGERFFLKKMEEFRRMDIGDEKFSLMKAYLCYSVLSKDISSQNVLKHYLQILVKEEEKSVIKFNTFQWYLQILEKGYVPKQTDGHFNNTVLRRNQFFETFQNYKNVYLEITERCSGLGD